MSGLRSLLAAIVLSLCVSSTSTADELENFLLQKDSRTAAGGKDYDGLKRDTWYFLGYQWVTIGVLYALPESVSGWSEEQKSGYSLSIWWDNATHPQWDSDKFYLNYVLHPYWGASYFVRARERGYNKTESFWYSVLLSSMYEFGAEALFEEASIQDLIVTPVAGSLLGLYFMDLRDDIRRREFETGERRTRDKWIWVLTDPLGSINQQTDKLFGRETSLKLQPFDTSWLRDDRSPHHPLSVNPEPVYGIQLQLNW